MPAILGSQTIDTTAVPKWAAAGVDGTTARNYTLEQRDVASLKYDKIETKLHTRSVLNDVYMQNIAEVNFKHGDSNKTIPSEMTMMIKAESGTNSVSIPFTDPISGPARSGRSERQTGYEVDQSLRYMDFHWNEESQAVLVKKWGKDFSELEAHLGLFSEAQPKLSLYFKELEGRQFREAGVLGRSRELIKDNGGLKQYLNPNIFIANVDPNSMPSWNANNDTYEAAIIAAMQGADTGTGTAGEYANLSIEMLDAMLDYARVTLKISPLKIGGEDRWIFICPSNQLSKLNSAVGQVGNLWHEKAAVAEEGYSYSGVMGRYKELIIVADDRYATCDVDYADGDPADGVAGSMSFQFVEPGNIDNRDRAVYHNTTNTVWSVGMFCGAGAFGAWSVRDLHFEEEKQEYGKEVGIGGFREKGIELALLKNDLVDGTSGLPTKVENIGSMAVYMTNTSIYTVK